MIWIKSAQVDQITYMGQMSYNNVISHSHLSLIQLKYKELFHPWKKPGKQEKMSILKNKFIIIIWIRKYKSNP